jgi:uncharacterized RDD family membrane protein YckC
MAPLMREQKYRTGAKRIGAAIVDGIVFLPLVLFERWLLNATQNITILISWTIFSPLLPIFYSIFLHYKYGQTIGKWVVGVKVLHISETRTLTLRESILRDVVYLSLEIIALGYFLILSLKKDQLIEFVQDFGDFSATPLFAWNLIELITMLTNAKRRAIHDFIAKSVVVRSLANV